MALLVFAVVAQSCGLDKLTGDKATKTAYTFSVTGDSLVAVGVSRPYTVVSSPAGADFGRTSVQFTLTDTTKAKIDSQPGKGAVLWITGKVNGTASVNVVVQAPELPAGANASKAFRVKFNGVRFDPLDTIAGIGTARLANQRTPILRGTLPGGAVISGSSLVGTLVSRDTNKIRIVAAAGAAGPSVFARDTGAVWVVGTYDGSTDSVRIVVQRRVTSIAVPAITIGAVGVYRALPVRVLDAGDSAIVGAPYRVSAFDTLAIRVDTTTPALPKVQARRAGSTAISLASGAVSAANLPVTVTPVPAQVVIAGGAGQSAKYGTALPIAPSVAVQDSGGVGVAGVAVTFSVPNAGNGVITGATTTTNGAGTATVGSWVLGPNAGVDSLVASVTGLTARTITATALAGAKTQLKFVVQPAGAGKGTRVQPSPQVAIQDSVGNVVTSANDSVTLAATAAVGGTLSGRLTVAAVNGIARFDSVVFSDTATAARLKATSGTLAVDSSSTFRIGNAATSLLITSGSNSGFGGSRLAPYAIKFQDAQLPPAVAVGSADSVTVSLLATNGATLSGTLRKQAVAGLVSFSDLSIDKTGNYTLVFTASGGLSAQFPGININLGPAARLVFQTPPANTAPGVTQSLTVQVADSGGNYIFTTPSAVPIALRLTTNPSTATLTDTARSTSVGCCGAITFNPAVSAVGNGYVLTATSAGYIPAVSSAFNVKAAGTPAKIRFIARPFAVFLTAPTTALPGVELLDSAGVRTSLNNFKYTISLASAPPGATLPATAGDSVFSNGVSSARVGLTVAGSYRIVVSAPGVGADTIPMTVNAGSAKKIVLLSTATATGVNAPLPTIQAAVADTVGNVRTGDNGIAIAATVVLPTGVTATLSGTTPVNTFNGVASFSDLALNTAAPGYKISFSSGALTAAVTDTFTVRVPGTPVKVKLGALPTSINGGSPLSPVVRASILDNVGTVVSSRTDSITLSIIGGTGATLLGTAKVAAVNGVATFPTVTIPKADSLLRLIVVSNQSGIAPDTSATFKVNVGPANRLKYVTYPTALLVNAFATPSQVIAITDSGGNVITSATDTIGMQYLIGTSVYGASGAGYKKAAVNGIASFDVGAFSASAGTAVRFMPVGWNRSFSMRDTAPAITARVGPPARVKMLSQFTRVSQGGYYLTTAVQDAAGNVVDTATRTITVSIINAAALTGTTTATAVAGFAAHNNTVLLGPAIGARFVTTSPGLLPDTSAPFTIVGNVYKAKIVSMPATAVKGGVMGAVKVIPLDSLGNYPSFGGTGIGLSTTLGTLNGTLTRTATYAGTDTFPSAVFSDLSLSTAGTARLVTRFTNVGYAGVPDSGSALLVAPYSGPAVLQFVQQPSSIVAGSTMSTTPTVAIRDSVGNLVTDSVARPVLLSLGTNPGAATLTGTLSASATPGTGIVSFPNISVNNVGNGYTLIATTTVPGVQGAASASFNALTTTDALALRFINTSVTSLDTAGTALGAAGGIQVEVINSAGSRVTTSTAPISLAVTNPRGGVLTGTVSVNAVAGLATFSSAVLTRADTGYSIVATSPSLNSSTAPVRLTVLPAAAAKLVVLDSLPLTVAGATWPAMRVAITDAFANVVTTAANSVTLRVGTGNYPGDSSFTYYSGRIGGVGAAAPVLTVAATNGIATFTGLRPRNLSTASSTSGFNFIFFDATGLTAGRSPKFDVVGSTATSAVSYVYSNTGSYLNNIGAINNQGIQVAGFFLDSLRNNTTGSGNVTLQLAKFRGGSITSGATLVGNATGTALNGNFSIQGLKVSGLTVTDTLFFRAVVTGGSTVTFDSSYYGGIQYSPFGAATQLVFVNPPANTTVNTAIASPTGIKVAVADSIGNTVTNLNTGVGGLTGQISLELSTIPTGVTAVLSGSGPVNIVNGVATFASTAVNAVGTGYAMRARVQGGTSIPGVTAAIISALFNITP